MLKLESLAAFSAIAEAGSITGAARRLALSKSVVSERLSELERVVGTRLVRELWNSAPRAGIVRLSRKAP